MLTNERRAGAQGGYTLVELLVVTLIFGVVGTVVMSASIQALRLQASTTARMDAVHELEGAVQRVTRDLRSAETLHIPTDRSAEQHVSADVVRAGTTYRMSYSLGSVPGGRALVQTISEDGDLVAERELVTLVRDDATEVFRYLDRDNRRIVCDGTDSECSAVYGQAYAVAIRLERLVDGQEPVTVETVVNMRNVRYGGS